MHMLQLKAIKADCSWKVFEVYTWPQILHIVAGYGGNTNIWQLCDYVYKYITSINSVTHNSTACGRIYPEIWQI